MNRSTSPALLHVARLIAHGQTSIGECSEGDAACFAALTPAQKTAGALALESFASELRAGAPKPPKPPKMKRASAAASPKKTAGK